MSKLMSKLYLNSHYNTRTASGPSPERESVTSKASTATGMVSNKEIKTEYAVSKLKVILNSTIQEWKVITQLREYECQTVKTRAGLYSSGLRKI